MILFFHILAEILAPFYSTLLILTVVTFTVRLVAMLNTILDMGISIGEFIRIICYAMPIFLVIVTPISSLIAVTLAFSRMIADNEIRVLKAAGVSTIRMAAPVFFFAASVSLLVWWTYAYLLPTANIALKTQIFHLARQNIAKGFHEGQFSSEINNMVFHIDEVEKSSGRWNGVYIVIDKNKEYPSVIVAKHGQIRTDLEESRFQIILEEGTIHHSKKQLTTDIDFETFDFFFSIPSLSGNKMLRKDKFDMNQKQLLDYIHENKYPGETFGALKEFHTRNAFPFGAFLLTLLGLPLTLFFSRPGVRNAALPLGLLSFFIYYLLLSAAKSDFLCNLLSVGISLWVPNIMTAVLLLICFRIANKDKELPIYLLSFLSKKILRTKNNQPENKHSQSLEEMQSAGSQSQSSKLNLDNNTVDQHPLDQHSHRGE